MLLRVWGFIVRGKFFMKKAGRSFVSLKFLGLLEWSSVVFWDVPFMVWEVTFEYKWTMSDVVTKFEPWGCFCLKLAVTLICDKLSTWIHLKFCWLEVIKNKWSHWAHWSHLAVTVGYRCVFGETTPKKKNGLSGLIYQERCWRQVSGPAVFIECRACLSPWECIVFIC